GAFDMVKISGRYSWKEDGQVQESCNLLVTFADSDFNVFGGPLIGPLIAATPVQVTLGSFIN
ncbi:unnamed protein product, partial [Ilex paraguariensis]